jgi:hypothetical protein
MRARFGILLVLVTVLLAALPASAQSGAWSVWLYTPESGRLTQVNDAGTVTRELIIPLDTTHDAAGYPGSVAVSHSGEVVAYVTRSISTDIPVVNVLDVSTQDIIRVFEMPAGTRVSLEFDAGPLNFSESDSQIAFSHGMEAGGWQVIVLDLFTSDVFVLNGSDPAAIAAGVPAGPFIVPIVRAYRGALVYFIMLPIPSDAFGGPGYFWDTTTNLVGPTLAYGNLNSDTLLMTGEVLAPADDSRFPFSTVVDAFPMIQFNTLYVYDPVLDARFPFHTDADVSFYQTVFVQNGERIAAAGARSDGSVVVRLLERDGSVLGETGVSVEDIQGVFDGFVFLTRESALTGGEGITALYYTETRGGLPAAAGVPVWTNPTPDEFVTLIWNSDNFTPGPVAPLAWARLAEPEFVGLAAGAPPVAPPTFVPPTVVAAPAGLAVGADAIVNTTEGDSLRLRTGAGRSFAIIMELADETRVTIIEGPRAADGLVWWRVRLADGTTGWCVESVDGIQTLLPVTAG